jgi:hypothetical protein
MVEKLLAKGRRRHKPVPLEPPVPPMVSTSTDVALKANAEHSQALRHLRVLLRRGGVNLAEFQARLYETEAVDQLARFMRDERLEPEFRRRCIKDILDRARGTPMGVARVEVPDLAASLAEDVLFREVQEGAESALAMQEMQTWLAKPLAQWPAHIRAKYEAEASLLTSIEEITPG